MITDAMNEPFKHISHIKQFCNNAIKWWTDISVSTKEMKTLDILQKENYTIYKGLDECMCQCVHRFLK